MPEFDQDPRTDGELIAAVNDGDMAAFEILYRRHRDWTANLAFRFVGDHDLALDVLQDTFLYFVKKFPGFKLTCQFRSFLYPAIRHLAIAARRQAARHQGAPEELENLEAPPTETESHNVRDEFTQALAGLSAEHREVLLIRFVDGLSLNEIAAALAIPLGTVKSRLHNALGILRRDERTRSLFDQ